MSPVTVVGQEYRTMTVIDKEEIEDKHSSVAYDVLETQPGLHVVRRLGMTGAGLSRLTIRGNGGVGPAGIQVYVDGRPDSSVSFTHPAPAALSLENTNRIEVSLTVARSADKFDVFGSFFVPCPFTNPRTESLDLTQTVYDVTLNANFDNIQSSLKLYHDDLNPTIQILDGGEERAKVTATA